jgi:hypothetical protein
MRRIGRPAAGRTAPPRGRRPERPGPLGVGGRRYGAAGGGTGGGSTRIVQGIVTPHSPQKSPSSATQRKEPHRSHFRGSEFSNRQVTHPGTAGGLSYERPSGSSRPSGTAFPFRSWGRWQGFNRAHK